MNTRLRWMFVAPVTRATLAHAVDAVRKDEYVVDAQSGFIVERVRPGFIEARFIERFERLEDIFNPFGEAQRVTRVEYQQTRFRLSQERPQLEIYDGPRSISPLLNRLSMSLGPDSTAEAPVADVMKWLRMLTVHVNDVWVTSAQIARLSLSETVSARLTVSGTEDVRKFVKEMVGDRKFRFERLDLVGSYQGSPVRFELKEEGRATIRSGPEELLEHLRNALSEVASNGTDGR